MAAVLVQLHWEDGHSKFGRAILYVTPLLSTTARSMHHANAWNMLMNMPQRLACITRRSWAKAASG